MMEEGPPAVRPVLRTVLGRGLRRKCPHCGRGDIHERRRLREHCAVCGYIFERRGGDLYLFLYVGAGAITFVFIVCMYVFRIWSYGWAIRGPYLAVGIAAMIGLMPVRMGVAVALDYLLRRILEDPAQIAPKPVGPPPAEKRAGSDAESGPQDRDA